MDLLVLGGTAFLGREVAREALARGHDVVCAARGRSGEVTDGARLVVLDRDLEDGLRPVAGRSWDAVIDLARQPGHVRRAVRDLTTQHWVLVSTGNVYADTSTRGQTEDAALLDPLESDVMTSMEHYGPAKVSCERHVRSTASYLIARAGLIGGPGDASGRTGYWPRRFAHPSGPEVLVPAALDAPAQIIDVRDLAGWLVTAAERRTQGIANALGETLTLADVLDTAATTAGFTGPRRAATTEWLVEQGVAEWMGPRSLPLWIADPDWQGFCAHDGSHALSLGLTRRPLAQTLRDTLDWEESQAWPHGAGLTDAEERTLVDALSADS